MERILLYPNDSQSVEKLNEECGVLRFYNGNTLLYITETANLQQRFKGLMKLQELDENVRMLFNSADSLEVDVTSSLTEALIIKKATLDTKIPEYNTSINLWQKYVYLAINPAEFPFCKITEFTDEDWFYIGPFKSRFFLADLMELMMKLLKLPYCEVKSGPCEKLEDEQCRGWCTLIKRETENEDNDDKPNLEKLDALLKEAFVHADNGLYEMVLKEKEKYHADLQFAKADLLTESIDLLKRYKQWLAFLYGIKSLTYDTPDLSVRNGQIIKYRYKGKEFDCPYIKTEYRGNELLAINKNMVDEAWIIYQERT